MMINHTPTDYSGEGRSHVDDGDSTGLVEPPPVPIAGFVASLIES